MLGTEADLASSEALEESRREEEASLPCSCGRPEDNMSATLMKVLCEGNVTCTPLNGQPGATIVSPILLSLSGVTGQIWALYYLYTSTRPQHSRTVFFVLLSTLIWTDLFGKVITTGPALAAYVKGSWVGGVWLCNFHGFSMMLISLVTHLLVSTMAVERFLGIRHGYYYNKNVTPSRTKLLLLSIWLFSLLFCGLPLLGFGQYGLQYPGSWCYVNIHVNSSSPLHARIYTNVFGLFTLFNLLVMVFCNVVVITTLLCLRLCRQRCLGSSSFTAPQRTYRQRELELQMVIVLLVITIVFIISWSPIDMRLFLNQLWPHRTQSDHMQDLIAVRLTSINQIVDPWAYIICRKVFSTRAWRWMRLSLMGSRLLARESSGHQPGGSNKKTSQKAKPQEKIQYKTHFKEEATQHLNKEVVVVMNPPVQLPSKDSLNGEQEHKKPLETKDGVEDHSVVEVFKGSIVTPSGCSHSGGAAKCNPSFHGDGQDLVTLSVVPIPVFTSQQYRVCPPGDQLGQMHLTRLTSSASPRRPPTRPQGHGENSSVECGSSWAGKGGRRHSWGCPHDSAEADGRGARSAHASNRLFLVEYAHNLPSSHHYNNNNNNHQAYERNCLYGLNCQAAKKAPCSLGYRSQGDVGGADLVANDYSAEPNDDDNDDDSVFIIDNEVTRWRDKAESLEGRAGRGNGLFSCLRRSSTYRDRDAADPF